MAPRSDPSRHRKGLNAAGVRQILDHYENQTEEGAVAEVEAAFGRGLKTVMEIPTAVVPEVLAIIAQHQKRAKPVRTRRRKTA
jgi:hypothetical protein